MNVSCKNYLLICWAWKSCAAHAQLHLVQRIGTPISTPLSNIFVLSMGEYNAPPAKKKKKKSVSFTEVLLV